MTRLGEIFGPTVVFLLLVVGAAWVIDDRHVLAQTNPCTATPPTTVELNPTKIYAQIDEYTATEPDGSARITDFQIANFRTGEAPDTAATPVQGPSTIPKSGFTLVAGTTNCYVANVIAPIPAGVSLQGFLRARRAKTATLPEVFSPWSVASNPFGSAPATLAQIKVLLVAR